MLALMKMQLIFALLICLLATSNAHAYLDPGTGSLITQLLVGGAAGVGVLLKLFLKKIRGFVTRAKSLKL